MIYTDLKSLVVCRDLLEDAVIQKTMELSEMKRRKSSSDKTDKTVIHLQSELAGMLMQQAEKLGIFGNVLPAYIVHLLAEGGNTAARAIEAAGGYGVGLLEAMEDDMIILQPYLSAMKIGRAHV